MEKTVYSQFNPPPKRKLGPFTDGMTKQSFKDECDINSIVKKALRNGLLPDGNVNPIYGDFSDVKEYQEGLNIVLRAESQFNSLPAHVRSKFENDPAKFLEFATDPSNKAEMVSLGLAKHSSVPPVLTPEEPKSKASEPSVNKSSGGSEAKGP